MKSIILAAVLATFPVLAFAADTQPITLSGREYEAILADLANRDEVMRFLNGKEQAAQQAAAEHARAEAAKLGLTRLGGRFAGLVIYVSVATF